jgi:hypothetical protein
VAVVVDSNIVAANVMDRDSVMDKVEVRVGGKVDPSRTI